MRRKALIVLLSLGTIGGFASGIMGLAVWGCHQGLTQLLGSEGLGARLLEGLLPVVVGAVVYGLICRAMRIPELLQISRRLGRSRRA